MTKKKQLTLAIRVVTENFGYTTRIIISISFINS